MSDEDKMLVKVTVEFYYSPDLSKGGQYWEYGGEYGRNIQLCRDIQQAAAFDLQNHREGQFSLCEYISFGGDDDLSIKAEVVSITEGVYGTTETVVYTVPENIYEEPPVTGILEDTPFDVLIRAKKEQQHPFHNTLDGE